MCAAILSPLSPRVTYFKPHHLYMCCNNFSVSHERLQSSQNPSRKNISKDSKPVFNEMKIQMLPQKLQRQIFKPSLSVTDSESFGNNISENIQACIEKLKKFDLWDKNNEVLPDVDLSLPPLKGENLDAHFRNIAIEQSAEYFDALVELSTSELPRKPEKWEKKIGWTKYSPNEDGSHTGIAVNFPNERGLVFDIEVLVPEGDNPIMATAVSKNCWYSWCSDRIFSDKQSVRSISALIPLETAQHDTEPPKNSPVKVIVGHNVAYDRARIKEQYFVEESNMRFVDTMSLHIAISGFTGTQRMLYQSAEKNPDRKNEVDSNWLNVGTMNNLSDVHNHYCGSHLKKSIRETFVKGTIEEVRSDFQNLMNYCSGDVQATHNVLKKIFPVFYKRFPNPVTFAAMLEMGQMYLPINRHWEQYIKNADASYSDMNRELKSTLTDIANSACGLIHGEKYKTDPWMWDVDWTTQPYKLLKKPRKEALLTETSGTKGNEVRIEKKLSNEEKEFLGKSTKPYKTSLLMQSVIDTASLLPKVKPHLPGYPLWYRELCLKNNNPDWEPGPTRLSTLTKVTPRLLRMTWNGYTLHHDRAHGWGYLVPSDKPLKPPAIPDDSGSVSLNNDIESESVSLDNDIDSEFENESVEIPQLPVNIENLPKGFLFYKLPHKYGVGKNVGSPLSHDFMQKLEDGSLSSADKTRASRCLEINISCSYWRSSQNRIRSQVYRHLPEESLPLQMREHQDYRKDDYGAIIPLTISMGTVTRRAVEATWLTASNVREKSIGSELKAMIQAPPGYEFVGADVDSQELWIASLLGDADAAAIHGCTPLSWMTLQGNKSDATDLHSKTASAIHITRDEAKAFNYARIYGAGQRLSKNMLTKFNHSISQNEAAKRIDYLYKMTKGERKYLLSLDGRFYLKKLNVKVDPQALRGGLVTMHELNMIEAAATNAFGHLKPIRKRDLIAGRIWHGGIESEMFNRLEKIARNLHPCTPFLGARISRALEPSKVHVSMVVLVKKFIITLFSTICIFLATIQKFKILFFDFRAIFFRAG